MKLLVATLAASLSMASVASANTFSIQFEWGNLKSCTTGNPNTVPNPKFTVSALPAGTSVVEFRLKDLDVPGFNHGGAKVKMAASGEVPAGIFNYQSPCPPNGRHTYEWTATAINASGQKLGTAKARRYYPE